MAFGIHRANPRSSAAGGTTGTLRVDARTKNLTKRLQTGDIAIINHEDLDRVSADALVACAPMAVINAARSITGRYPNQGPALLLDAGIPLVDDAGCDLLERVSEGTVAGLRGGDLLVDGEIIATGALLTRDAVDAAMERARESLGHEIESFAENTLQYLRQERELLIDGVGVPDIRTDLDGRHVLIVVRGHHYKEDLAILRPYIREYRPVLIGVDGGADAILEAGLTPTMIVGDMDSVSDAALTCGAEIVVHAYRDGRAPGMDRVEALGMTGVSFPAMGTSEDVAMLLADDKGASLIVAVGTHATLEEFLDKGRAGMSSTFLTRLRVGSKLVDAKGVSRLYRSRISLGSIALLLAMSLVALLVALMSTPGGRTVLELLGTRWDDLLRAIEGVFP